MDHNRRDLRRPNTAPTWPNGDPDEDGPGDPHATDDREDRRPWHPLRIAVVWILISLLVTVGATALEAVTTRPRPKIEVTPQVVDVGVVAQGAVINASVLVANRGDATLKVWQILPTEGGTRNPIKLDLEPGQEQVVALPPLDTSGFTGPIQKAILLFTNDPDHPQFNLVQKALVWTFVEVLPRRFVRIDVEEGSEQVATVVVASKDAFDILSAAADDPRLSVSFEPAKQKGFAAAFKLALRLAGRDPYKILSPQVVVRTSHPFAPTITLRVSGLIRPVILVVPHEISFGIVDGTASRNVVVVFNGQGEGFSIQEPQIDDSAFRARVVALQPGKRFQLSIEVAAGARPGHHQATITLLTNESRQPRLTIPVTADVGQ